MCGISGFVSRTGRVIVNLTRKLELMNRLQKHRGPDGQGVWEHTNRHVGLGHVRLSIIDLSNSGNQPMSDGHGNWISFNGEIYNYLELRRRLGEELFVSKSDTEVIVHGYRRWGRDCVRHLRGMFSFAIWDEQQGALFCARDRFGIKPLYYVCTDAFVAIASEIKALLPFLPEIRSDAAGLRDYLTFQFCLTGKTLFHGVQELLPGHCMWIRNGVVTVSRYWDVYYNLDFDHSEQYFAGRLQELLQESILMHLRSDVPVGAYVSGGLDSSIIAAGAQHVTSLPMACFTGKFGDGPEFDESMYARALANHCGLDLHERLITADDFIRDIRRVIYHLDYPVAGPGSFSQYVISETAARHRKVVLGGQGGDEIFGGYTRYLIAYFEQCIKAAIDGVGHSGNFVVTYESIIPNLRALKNYKPLIQDFWREGLFEDMDRRYFRLVNRAPHLEDAVRWEQLGDYCPFETFQTIFNGQNVGKESYFDKMTHFDFKTLLPALLHVEDRMSMAHGLESRVPLLDHPLVEFAATIPANTKFKAGEMKHILLQVAKGLLPSCITERKDKMGFPTPFAEWLRGSLKDYVMDVFAVGSARNRDYIDSGRIRDRFLVESRFGRSVWGLFCLELWHQEFHDRSSQYKALFHETERT